LPQIVPNIGVEAFDVSVAHMARLMAIYARECVEKSGLTGLEGEANM
jgi:hypothetical protein